MVLLVLLFLSLSSCSRSVHSNEWFPKDISYCEVGNRRNILSMSNVNYAIEIKSVHVNSNEINRGDELKFKISAKLWEGELTNPIMQVYVYNKDDLNRPFLSKPFGPYTLCTGYGLECPIKPETEAEIIVTQSLKEFKNIPSSMIKEPFVLKGIIENDGNKIECVQFEIKIN